MTAHFSRLPRVGILTSHPIQYQTPWFRDLAQQTELRVYFAHRPDAVDQGVGFGKVFTWDVDLLSGYDSEFLPNISKSPDFSHFCGCDTPEIVSRIRDGGFDGFIVCGWHLKSFWQAVRACRRYGVPVLTRGDSQLGTPRSLLKRWAKGLLYPQLLRQFDAFLAVGSLNRDYLKHYGIADSRIFSAPHFVDNDWFATLAAQSDREQTRASWGCTAEDRVILFVGKFTALKRPGDLIEAVLTIPESQRPVIVFVGAGESETALVDRCSETGIRYKFTGFKNQSELPACYAAADALVLPSAQETWGLVVNEAMACGTPAIVSDTCGCAADLIDPGVTGYCFPTGDVAALGRCLQRLHAQQRSGHDWGPALRNKLRNYSVQACVLGTLGAIDALSKSNK